jgi:methylated-DNA-[protein]-cysteine S-methyltransferase
LEQYLGGFKGDWEKAPSGINQTEKVRLLAEEGVTFDVKGMLVDKSLWWDDFKVATSPATTK